MSRRYIRVCALRELPDEGVLGVEVNGNQVAVARSGGEVYAMEDRCTHSDVPLSEGEVYDGVIECWLHGSRFDLRTGKADCNPATEPVPVYGTRIEGDAVLVELTVDEREETR